jgi:hypothetical protein
MLSLMEIFKNPITNFLAIKYVCSMFLGFFWINGNVYVNIFIQTIITTF